MMYLIGCDRWKKNFHLITIKRTSSTEETDLNAIISEDPDTYTKLEIQSKLRDIHTKFLWYIII